MINLNSNRQNMNSGFRPLSPTEDNPIEDAEPVYLNIRSKASIIHIGSLDSFNVTEGGKSAAKYSPPKFSVGMIRS